MAEHPTTTPSPADDPAADRRAANTLYQYGERARQAARRQAVEADFTRYLAERATRIPATARRRQLARAILSLDSCFVDCPQSGRRATVTLDGEDLIIGSTPHRSGFHHPHNAPPRESQP